MAPVTAAMELIYKKEKYVLVFSIFTPELKAGSNRASMYAAKLLLTLMMDLENLKG